MTREEAIKMLRSSQTPPKTPKGGSSAERNDKITIDVEAKGLEELTEQVEDLRDAISTAPRVLIKNPRDCTITVNEAETKQEVKKENPNKMIEGIRAFSRMCNETERCSDCSFKGFCEKAGQRFVPYEWDL